MAPTAPRWTSATPEAGLAARLWADNVDLARACLADPFVQGLAHGTLPVAHFRAYLAQDAYFLDAFARAYALALARSPDAYGLREFHRLIGGVLDELALHATYAQRWEIDLAHVVAVPATLAYTDFLLATASLQRVAETCAAMTPCMRLYAYLGQQLAPSAPDNPYHEWVDTYSSAEFEALASTLEALLNRYAEPTPAVETTYRRAMELELRFFQAHAPAD